MDYKPLQQCISDLDKQGELLRITKEVNPELEMASIHLNEFEKEGKAILFKNVKGSKYAVVSNLFGSLKRSHFMFRDSLEIVKQLIDLKTNPISAIKNPIKSLFIALNGIYAIPQKVAFPKSFNEIQIEDLPQIKCWKDDGGAFITLPQVYSEDIEKPGTINSNLGMYRIQLSGNEYVLNEKGLAVDVYPDLKRHRNILSQIKTTNNIPHVLAGIYKNENNLDDCLVLNDQGRIVEGLSSNVFL